MENEKRVVVEELSNTYKKKEKLINILFEESLRLGFTIEQSKENIKYFYNKYYKNCSGKIA